MVPWRGKDRAGWAEGMAAQGRGDHHSMWVFASLKIANVIGWSRSGLVHKEPRMNALIALLFCLLCGAMIMAQGWYALIWTPVGFIISLYATAQMVLPLVLGIPRAARLIRRKEMRAAVLIPIVLVPLSWAFGLSLLLFCLGWFFPSAADFAYNNLALNMGMWLGTLAILVGPFSARTRNDFRSDFDNAYCKYQLIRETRKPSQENYIEAVIQVGTNLYLYTLPGSKDAPAPLAFRLPDSRYRYLLFCLGTAAMASLVYDEKKEIQPQKLLEGCKRAATWLASEQTRDYFDAGFTPADPTATDVGSYLQNIINHWAAWPDLAKANDMQGQWTLISRMVHSAESNEPPDDADLDRLGPLALEITCRMPTMQRAALELAERKRAGH